MLDYGELKTRQALSLEEKIRFSQVMITEWYEHFNGNVYVSFSGGKDSTVLLSLVRYLYPEVPGVFVDTGLEYPEIRAFVKSVENVIWIKPKMKFPEVIEKYGYPVVSKEVSQYVSEIRTTRSGKLRNKRLYGDEKGNGKLAEKWKFLISADFKISNKCCDVLKKRPIKMYEKETGRRKITGLIAADSRLRMFSYLKTGCNNFNGGSMPLGFWTEQDIWAYIKKLNLGYSKVYDLGYERTGCMFCMFGIHRESRPNRFDKMALTHPRQYKFCMDNLEISRVLETIWQPKNKKNEQ